MSYYSEEELLQQRTLKQQYLKTEIIEKGYDGGAFADYLNQVKPDGGGNVDIWSLDELKELVQNFKAWVLQQSSEPAHEEQMNNTMNESNWAPTFEQVADSHEPENITDSKFHQQRDLAKAGLQGQNVLPEESKHEEPTEVSITSLKTKAPGDGNKEDNYAGQLNVKLAETTQLREATNMEILVHGFEQTKSGLFSITHTSYLVRTLPMDWNVKRRYSDFFWLRQTLQKMHPGLLIPPIPQKKNKNKAKRDFLKKRMYFLQRFLNACVLNDELRNDKYLYAFLNSGNESQYKNAKKDAEKRPRYHRIKDIATLSGQVNIEVNNSLRQYAQSMGEFSNSADPIYGKIRKLGKQLISDFEQASNTLYALGECYAGLYSAASNFNKTTEAGKNLHLEDIYLTMNNTMVSWAQQLTSQNENIQNHFTYFYKYAQYENEAFKEVLEVRTKTGLEYLQRKKDLLAKKERLFLQKDLSKWEASSKAKDIPKEELFKDKNLAFDVMLSKETASLKELRTSFGYYNAQAFTELDNALREKTRQYAKNFHEFGLQQADIMNQVQTKWAEFLIHFMDSNVPVGGSQREILTKADAQKNDLNMTQANFEDD